jgi:L-ascorbate metabolism protein UlaG (beta-lactamase superfamily)
MSGDTQDVPEMRALQNIDVAFVCMNLPFTMTVDAAASAVRQFQPRVVYPYHYSSSDVNRFKQLVGTDLGYRSPAAEVVLNRGRKRNSGWPERAGIESGLR